MSKEIPPRPVWNDKMEARLAHQIGRKFKAWCDNKENFSEEISLKECIDKIKKIIKFHHDNYNGYELARLLEREFGFHPNLDLVSILDNTSTDSHEILGTYVEDWVANYDLKLDLSNGQKVEYKSGFGHNIIKGEIMMLFPETMQYSVLNEDGSSKMINYEDITKVITHETSTNLPKEITLEELKKYDDYLTVGKLKELIAKYNLPDDGKILIERVEDVYYEKDNWGVVFSPGFWYERLEAFNKNMEEEIKRREKEEEPEYPQIENPQDKIVTLGKEYMSQYHPAWYACKNKEDDNNLYIDLHY